MVGFVVCAADGTPQKENPGAQAGV